MSYLLRPNLDYRACCYNSAPDDLNPGIKQWQGAFLGNYNRRNEPLGNASNTPKILQTEGVQKTCDFFGPAGAAVTVSERFRNLIEEFEPGVHEFVPVRLIDGRKRDWPGNFYLLRVRQWLTALLVDRSGLFWRTDCGGDYHISFGPPENGYFMNARQISGFHLWQHHPCFGYTLICSDDFYKACKAAKLKYFRWTKCIDVDEPWEPAGNEYPTESSDIR